MWWNRWKAFCVAWCSRTFWYFLYICFCLDPCMAPLGMSDGRIVNYRLTASSEYNNNYRAQYGRLQSRKGGWVAASSDRKPYIQADLETMSRVKGVAIQGSYNANQFVKSFTVSFSRDGSRFYLYKEGRGTKVGKRPDNVPHSFLTLFTPNASLSPKPIFSPYLTLPSPIFFPVFSPCLTNP